VLPVLGAIAMCVVLGDGRATSASAFHVSKVTLFANKEHNIFKP
jgi:hypothetical protein